MSTAGRVIDGLQAAIGRGTSRLMAAAVSMLLLSAVVVVRSDRVLSSDAATGGNLIVAGSVELRDDDDGRSLFDLTDLGPDRPVSRCVEVSYIGTIVPAGVWLTVRGAGPLSDFLLLRVEQGRGGNFEACEGFEPDRVVIDGLLAAVSDQTSGEALLVKEVRQSPSAVTFRITVEILDDGDAAGLDTALDFFWETAPR